MFDKDTWQEILGTMRKNKLRTGLTALGVFWGIFMLVFLLGMGNGLETGVFRSFGNGSVNIMYVWGQNTTVPYKGLPAGRRVKLNIQDVFYLKENVDGIKDISPRFNLGTQSVVYRDKKSELEVKGEFPTIVDVEGYKIKYGRFINQKDIDEKRKVTAIGESVRAEMFGNESGVGKHILVNGIDYKVVGVFTPREIKEWTKKDMESVVLPLTTLYKAFGVQNERVHWFIVSAQDDVQIQTVEPKIRQLLRSRHDVAPSDKSGIGGFNLQEQYNNVKNLFLGISALLWFVGIGSLIAGIVGVSNIMLITVKERTKEIGIRKALGATPSSIISMILTESVFITAVSGYLGLMCGTFLIAGINYLMISQGIENENFYNPIVNGAAALSALILLILSGTMAGLIPALQASKVNPVLALKDE